MAAFPSGLSANGPDFSFGNVEEVYLSKWPDKYGNDMEGVVEFKIWAYKLVDDYPDNITLTDSLVDFSSTPFDISHNGVYENGIITWSAPFLRSLIVSFKIGLH